ncbi:hypothetical protein ACET3X_009069 [Alternaria dauci]|uniref:Uncharacterized protein n=1 Tax=Alternaria dauci TaxID=48095 RepID=A0ABR3U7R7_9PLEO
MAGRILPVALATIVGVSIGVATFDGEFKKQRIARLEEEYKRELAAAASPGTATTTPATSSGTASPPSAQLQAQKEDAVASAPADNSWSNMLGLWAWKKDNKTNSAPATSSVENSKGKP